MSIYTDAVENQSLSERAKQDIFNNLKTLTEKRVGFFALPQLRAAAAVTLSAAIICGVAFPVGIYLNGNGGSEINGDLPHGNGGSEINGDLPHGNGGSEINGNLPFENGGSDTNEEQPSEIKNPDGYGDGCVKGGYISYEVFEGESSEPLPVVAFRSAYLFETDLFDAENVNMTLFYGISRNEFCFDQDFSEVAAEFSGITVSLLNSDFNLSNETDYELLDEIPVGEIENGAYIVDRIPVGGVDDIPYEEYAITERYFVDPDPDIVCGSAGTVEVTYAHSCGLVVPQELFAGDSGLIRVCVTSFITLKNGVKLYFDNIWPPVEFRYEKVGDSIKISAA